MRSLVCLLLAFFFSGAVFAQTGPQGLTLQGRILDSSDSPVVSANVDFTIQIRSHGAENCILFEEAHTGVNMSGSNGVFSLRLGSGNRVSPSTNFKDTSTIAQAFSNKTGLLSSLTCDLSQTSYTPAAGHRRKVVVTFDDHSGAGVQTMAQNLLVEAVPYSLAADTLQGLEPAELLQVKTSGAALSQANLESVFSSAAAVTELVALASGASTHYMSSTGGNFTPSSSMNFNSQRITNLSDPTSAQDAATKNYCDGRIGGSLANTSALAALGSGDNGKVLAWNGTQWVAQSNPSSQWVNNSSDIYFNSGKVGIGATNPKVPLELVGAPGIAATSGTTSNGIMRIGQGISDNVMDFGSYGSAPWTTWIQSANRGSLGTTNPLALNPNGGIVGVGLDSPQATFDVGVKRGGGYGIRISDFSDSFNLRGEMRLSSSGNGVLALRDNSTTETVLIHSAGDTYFNGGKVGIGTATPSDKLHVLGDVRVGTSGSNGCVNNASGGVVAGSCSSDIRFKKDIRPLSDVSDALARVAPAHYYWRADEFPDRHFGESEQLGVIAQQVQSVLPELVETDRDGFLRVRYSDFTMYLLKGFAEHHARLQELDMRCNSQQGALEREIASLRTENADLKQKLEHHEKELQLIRAKLGL